MKKESKADGTEFSDADLIKMGQKTFSAEAETLKEVGQSLDQNFATALRTLFNNEGRVLITGLGKSGIVARKMAATFTSTGTPSHFIHPVEAVHGDLGVVRQGDVLIAISRSGNNAEVVALLASCRRFGMTTMSITGGLESELAQSSDIVLHTPVAKEACPLNLTPTSSAVAAMAMGDALATSLISLRGFRAEDFALFHPSGTLGRSLLVKVAELMHTGNELPIVQDTLTLRESLPEIVDKKLGGVCVVDADGRLRGLCVDGDVKRVLLENESALDMPITAAMNERPTTIGSQVLAVEALRIMQNRKRGPVTLLIVVDDDQRPVGLLHIHDVLRAGLL